MMLATRGGDLWILLPVHHKPLHDSCGRHEGSRHDRIFSHIHTLSLTNTQDGEDAVSVAKAELKELTEALRAAKTATHTASKKLSLSQAVLAVIKDRVKDVAPDALHTMRHRSAVPQGMVPQSDAPSIGSAHMNKWGFHSLILEPHGSRANQQYLIPRCYRHDVMCASMLACNRAICSATFQVIKAVLHVLGKDPETFSNWKRAFSYFNKDLFKEVQAYDATQLKCQHVAMGFKRPLCLRNVICLNPIQVFDVELLPDCRAAAVTSCVRAHVCLSTLIQVRIHLLDQSHLDEQGQQ
eukprot:scaffold13580_cov17-Tisochrysis_lutea.AAC.1